MDVWRGLYEKGFCLCGAGAASIANIKKFAARERLASQNENLQKKTKRLAELKLHRQHRLERKLAAYQTMVFDCLCWLACAYTCFLCARVLVEMQISVCNARTCEHVQGQRRMQDSSWRAFVYFGQKWVH